MVISISLLKMMFFCLIFWMSLVNCDRKKFNLREEYKVEHGLQGQLISRAFIKCNEIITNFTKSILSSNMTVCSPVWDGVVCWKTSYKAGTLAHQPCPNYIDKFLKHGLIYKQCTKNATWYMKMIGGRMKPWTDFRSCKKIENITATVETIRIVSNIGFVISIGTVSFAIFILQIFKNLHCDRNTVHINLFIACLIRSISSLLSQLLQNNETNNLCKIFMSLHNYLVMANFTWVFVEALYLHNVLTLHTFKETTGLMYIYILIGWGMPLIAIVIWITLRLVLDNSYCWEYGDSKNRVDIWVLILYPTILLVQNLIFFIKLIVLLHAKMSDQQLTATQNKFKKLARSIIVLMVVFGLYHLIFIPLDFIENVYNKTMSMKFYLEYLMNSVQGLMLSMMFCFCNSEVLREIKRKFHNHCNSMSIRSSDGVKLREPSCRRRRQGNDSVRVSEQLMSLNAPQTQTFIEK